MNLSRLIVSLVPLVVLVWSSGAQTASSPSVGPLRVTGLDAPESVEVGTEFPVIISAAGEGGVAAVALSFEGRTQHLEADGGTDVRVLARLTARESRVQPIEAVAIGLDGRRSEPLSAAVAVSVSHIEEGPDQTQEILERLVDDRYVRRNGSAPYLRDRLYRKDKGGIGNSKKSIKPWWVRWQEEGGGPAFDWDAACGSGIPGITPAGEVLTCWLQLHPGVAQHLVWEEANPSTGVVTAKPYDLWTAAQKNELKSAFYHAWNWLNGGLAAFGGVSLVDPPVNQIPLEDCQWVVTGLTGTQAWRLYLSTVAHSLALEIGGFVPWTIVGYAAADLDALLHSKSFFKAGHYQSPGTANCPNSQVSYFGYVVEGKVIPAPAPRTFAFLVDRDIVRPDHYTSIVRLLTWARSHMIHIVGGPDARNMEAHYQYRGEAPASRVFEGTVYTDPDDPSHQWGPHGWSPSGCHGVSDQFRAMMRGANVPVHPTYMFGHRMPLFWTIGRTLSHGDDIYSSWSKVQPPFSAGLLLISQLNFKFWFLPPEGHPANIGRQPYEIARQLLPNTLVQMYCDDEANGLSHADGTVYDVFDTWYDVASLEAQGLWTKLAARAVQLGYCNPE